MIIYVLVLSAIVFLAVRLANKIRKPSMLLGLNILLSISCALALAWAAKALFWYYTNPEAQYRHEAMEGGALLWVLALPLVVGVLVTGHKLAAHKGPIAYASSAAVGIWAIGELVLIIFVP